MQQSSRLASSSRRSSSKRCRGDSRGGLAAHALLHLGLLAPPISGPGSCLPSTCATSLGAVGW